MASIPLPALAVQPPQQQPGPLQQFAAIQQIKAGQQEAQIRDAQIQQQQLVLRDQQAASAALHEWDGKDPSALPMLIAKHGGSAQSVIAVRGQILDQQAKYSDIAKNDALTGSTNIQTLAKKNDMLLGMLNTVKDDPTQLPNVLQNGVQQGILDPQHAQALQQLVGQPPDVIRKALDPIGKSLQGNQAQLDAASKQATIAKEQASTALSRAQLPGAQAESITKQAEAAVAPQKAKLGIQQQQTEIGKNRAQTAEAQATTAHTQLETQFLKSAPAGLQGVQPHLIAPAAAAYAKAGEEYASAHQAAQSLSDFIDAAKSGNKEAVKVVPLQGALEITTAQGVHRINRTEVDQLAGAGSMYDKLAGKINGAISGKSITDDVLNDMKALQQTIDKNATNLHANKVKTINTSYGSHFEPMDFSGAQGGGNNSPTSPASDPFAQFGGKAR